MSPPKPTLNVLVIDDSAVVRESMSAVLSRDPGVRVTVASDPVIAMEKMKRVRPDVIVLDLEMPRMHGLDFLRKVMTEDPLPVVVCSGLTARGTAAAMRALHEGAVEVVAKPELGVREFLHDSAVMLVNTVRAAAQARVRLPAHLRRPAGASRITPPPPPPALPAPVTASARGTAPAAAPTGASYGRPGSSRPPPPPPPVPGRSFTPAPFAAVRPPPPPTFASPARSPTPVPPAPMRAPTPVPPPPTPNFRPSPSFSGAGAAKAPAAALAPKIIAIGASTGGTEALRELLQAMPEGAPPIVIVQHMPPVFTAAFAASLAATCRIEVKEAAHGDRAIPGRALIAPGNMHMSLVGSPSSYSVTIGNGPLVSGHRPSVDVLFLSVAKAAGRDAVGALLTGMGSDGAEGMLAMRRAGAATIAQDERTCVVFGMPKEAIAVGAVDEVLPLPHIASALLRRAHGRGH